MDPNLGGHDCDAGNQVSPIEVQSGMVFLESNVFPANEFAGLSRPVGVVGRAFHVAAAASPLGPAHTIGFRMDLIRTGFGGVVCGQTRESRKYPEKRSSRSPLLSNLDSSASEEGKTR